VLVRYSGELIGTDGDADLHVAASFEVYIGEVAVEPHPRTHEATTNILPQIVSFTAFACGVPAGPTGVAVTLRPVDEDDVVATLFRTLEVWTDRPILSAGPSPFTGPAGQAPPNALRARRAFLASSDETTVARIDPAAVFEERVVLAGESSCLLVRFSGEVRGEDVDENGFVSVSFRTWIGPEVPPHPNLLDLTASEQPQVVTFSAFRCGLEAGPYDVRVEAESADDDDPVEVRSRVLEIFTETGRPAPALD
jgi:hypothetical protein